VEAASSLIKSALSGVCSSDTKQPDEWINVAVNYIFGRMAIDYESTYRKTWSNEDDENFSKRNWMDRIQKESLSKALVKNGMAAMTDAYPDWPPNLNGFIALCHRTAITASEAQSLRPGQLRLNKLVTDEERETVRQLANLIIPSDDRSGNAEEAGVVGADPRVRPGRPGGNPHLGATRADTGIRPYFAQRGFPDSLLD